MIYKNRRHAPLPLLLPLHAITITVTVMLRLALTCQQRRYALFTTKIIYVKKP